MGGGVRGGNGTSGRARRINPKVTPAKASRNRSAERHCSFHPPTRLADPHTPSAPNTEIVAIGSTDVIGRIAQLARALSSHGRGHRFESCCAH